MFLSMGALSRKAGDRTTTMASAVIVVVTKEAEVKSKDATTLVWVDAREGIVVDGRTSFRMAINAAADRTEDAGAQIEVTDEAGAKRSLTLARAKSGALVRTEPSQMRWI